MKRLAVIFLSCLGFSTGSYAQQALYGKMEVELTVPITATETQLLNFGKIIPDAEGGSVVITPQGERRVTGNIALVDEDYSAGKFVVSGMPNSLFTVQLPNTAQRLVYTGGETELLVDDFQSDVPAEGRTIRGNDGKAEVTIGARLILSCGLIIPSGYYAGSYE
jgi:hypothetical protein